MPQLRLNERLQLNEKAGVRLTLDQECEGYDRTRYHRLTASGSRSADTAEVAPESAKDMTTKTDTSMPEQWRPTSPKLTAARTNWYRYYAGYAAQFVRDVLDHLDLAKGATVFDPWNGSGTTTAVASEAGYRVIGYDANPALVVVALARQLDSGVVKSFEALTNDILDHARHQKVDTSNDPLGDWFDAATVGRLRAIERAIHRTQVDPAGISSIADLGVNRLSTLAAFFYVALFELTRSLIGSFRTSNPTWIKTGLPSGDLVTKSRADLEAGFRWAITHLVPSRAAPSSDRGDVIAVGDSTSLPLEKPEIDATLTSPPYCTRIDYVMATRPELAILGYGQDQLRDLRNAMVGTPTMWTASPESQPAFGPTATKALTRIGAHPSKASAGYYTRYFTQYFDALWRSLGEIRRVSQASAPAVLVVQDSYYKEIHVDLAAVVSEMLVARGWARVDAVPFQLPVTKAAIHPGARAYRTTFSATETVLIAR